MSLFLCCDAGAVRTPVMKWTPQRVANTKTQSMVSVLFGLYFLFWNYLYSRLMFTVSMYRGSSVPAKRCPV